MAHIIPPPRTSSSSATSSNASDYSIHLLCSIPGNLPRASKPTSQKLTLVATILSNHLNECDVSHAFLGRFGLTLRGAPYQPRWVDVEVSKPTIGGTPKIKEILANHPDFDVHNEVKEGHCDRLLVSHRCGIYVRMTVGSIPHLRKKTIMISVPTVKSQAPALLPLLTPARQFLETVIAAAGPDGRTDDGEDLIWLHDNLKMELLHDPSTLKKTWDEGRLQKVVETFPFVGEVIVDLGLAAIADGGSFENTQLTSTASRRSYS